VQGWLPRRHGMTGADPRPCVYYSMRRKGVTDLFYVFAPSPPDKPSPVRSVRPLTDSRARISAVIDLADGTHHTFTLLPDGSVRLRRG